MFKSPDQKHPEILGSIARTARRARICYENTRVDRRIWLLNKEVWSLLELGRNVEAQAFVKVFYGEYESVASDEYRFRFAMHQLRLSRYGGDIISAAQAFKDAELYSHAMSPEWQAHVLLSGVQLYLGSGLSLEALEIARRARDMTEGDSTLLPVHGRAILVENEIRLALEQGKQVPDQRVLEQTIANLERGRTLFREIGDGERLLIATIDMACAHAELGDSQRAFALFGEAMSGALVRDDVRTLIFAHLRRGASYLEEGALREAEADFTAGLVLADSSGLAEFERDLLIGLAETQEARLQYDKAQRLYRRVLEAALSSTDVASVRTSLMRVMEASERRGGALWLWAGLLVSLAVVGYVLVSRRAGAGRWLHRVARRRAPPPPLPVEPEGALLRERLVKVRRVLWNPEEVAGEIDDPLLAQVLAEEVTLSTDLFRCVAALEERAAGKAFENDPANTVGRYLRQEFKARHWPWPQTPEAWRQWLDGRP